MATEAPKYTIVVGIDFSESSDKALDQAIELAVARNAELHVLYVDDHFRGAEDGREAAEAALEKIEKHGITHMGQISEQLGKSVSFRHLFSHFRVGAPAEQVVQLAVDLNADLIVVGTHGRRGVQRLLMGSVSERVARLARCAVWIVREKDHEAIGRVPEIEPPCKDCVAKRLETNNAEIWCARHSERHIRAHALHYGGAPEGNNSFASTPRG